MAESIDVLASLRREIDARLNAYVESLPTQLGFGVSLNGAAALERLGEFALRPGKRMRGALAMVAYEMFGGMRHQTALDLALAVELIQDYLLIVDDVMDCSEWRRGAATVHRQYQTDLELAYAPGNWRHTGNMLGVTIGLIMQHLAARVLSELADDPERIVRAERLFHTSITATSFGQLDDLMNQTGWVMSSEEVRRMYVLKSGYYTFVNPLQLGAVLAGAGDEQLTSLRAFGEQAGLAFQLHDDLLGMFGGEQTTGKSTLDDLREGKLTLLMRHGLGHAKGDQLHVLRMALGNKAVTRKQHTQVQAVLTELGSRRYITQEASRASRAALAVLAAQTAWDEQSKMFLRKLVRYTVSRRQ